MQRITMTDEIMKYWDILHREARFTPKRPYCKLCSFIDPQHRKKSRINYFQLGETVYEVRFANDRVAYYHTECIENPRDMAKRIKVENIRKYDVDRWNTVKDFIENLRSKQLSSAQIVREIMERFNCSRATAYRKLQTSQTKFP